MPFSLSPLPLLSSSGLSSLFRRLPARGTLAGVGAALLLAACGGSTRVEDFVPTQIVTFGDELSLVQSDGRKYSINGFTTDTSVTPNTTVADCKVNEVWTQTLARDFGLAYAGLAADCRPTTIATANGQMKAAAGARVADVVAQVQAHGAAFTPQTLVTLQGGLHDVLDAYDAYLAGTLADRTAALAQVGARGAALAAQVDAITDGGNGGRVIYATVPDLGLSPKARKDQAAGLCAARGESCVTLLTDLSFRFNEDLRRSVRNDGRYAGVLPIDEYLVTMTNVANASLSNNAFGLRNTVDAACLTTSPLPACDTTTLVSGATGTSYLWADDLRPGPTWHTRVAFFAVARARNNPF